MGRSVGANLKTAGKARSSALLGRALLECVLRRQTALAGGLCLVLASPASGQALPDAGSLQRQLREGMPGLTPPVPSAPRPTPTPHTDNGERVQVQRFAVEGATLIPAAELESVLKDLEGRALGLADMQAAAGRIADLYMERGYFARTVLPPQDITGGTVRIRVIEGRFGRLILRDEASRADGDYVARVAGAGLEGGAVYTARSLERGLLLANDLPGVRVEGTLKAGETVGTTDLELVVTDTPLIHGSIGGDNSGSRSTGEWRGIGALRVDNITGRGDQLALMALGSEGLQFGQIGWSTPIGSNGWRAGVSATAMRYRVQGDFEALDARGEAYTQGVEISYPVLRSARETLRFRATYEHGRFRDDILGTALHRKEIHRVSIGMGGERRDNLGGGRTRYEATFSMGGLDLSDVRADEALDAATARTDGAFGRLNAELMRDQRLPAGLVARVRVSAQLALGGNLDSSEKFALGGVYGVRAYSSSEAAGDSGVLGAVELHRPITRGPLEGLDLYAFFDAGKIRRQTDTWPGWAGPGARNSYGLMGVGGGVSLTLPGQIALNAVVAAPIGSNPGGSTPGLNQDGSRRNARAWLNLTKFF